MIEIGPYRFSETDGRRTLDDAIEVLSEAPPAHTAAWAQRRARVTALLDGVDPWQIPADRLDGLLSAVWTELAGARDDLLASESLPSTATGTVAALHLGDGGVPKRAVDSVTVAFDGVVGDRQATRRHHGAPSQALCLWSVEVIAALAEAGHPIAPGNAGENVTIGGLPWEALTPGVRLRLGDVLCEISGYAVPCRQNAGWFSDRRFDRIHHRHGAVSRMYATVLDPGTVTVGDEAVLEP